MYRIVHHIKQDFYTVQKRRFFIWWTCYNKSVRIFKTLLQARSFIKEESKPKKKPTKQYIYD